MAGAGISPPRPRAFAHNLVWSVALLEWVAMTQAGAAGGGLTDAELRATPVPVSVTGGGDASAANQVTGNNSLGSIDTKLTSQATASKQDTLLTELQLKADLTETQPVSLASVPTHAVTGTFWQATQPMSAAALPLPTGAATETTLGTRLSEADFDTKAGSLTEAAPATDIASSGLNGRLQRIAQRLTSLIALLPAALVGGRLDTNNGAWLGSTTPTVGLKTAAASLPVVIASDQGAVPVSGVVTATPTTSFGKTVIRVPISQSAAGTTVLAGASVSNKHKIIGGMLVIDLTGTTKFTDGAGDLTGAMAIVTNGGFVWPTSIIPYLETTVTNTALNLITTVGPAKGFVLLLTEP